MSELQRAIVENKREVSESRMAREKAIKAYGAWPSPSNRLEAKAARMRFRVACKRMRLLATAVILLDQEK